MVTFIATAYNETLEANTFINSLLLQTDKRWKCIVFADGGNAYIKDMISEEKKFWNCILNMTAPDLSERDFINMDTNEK